MRWLSRASGSIEVSPIGAVCPLDVVVLLGCMSQCALDACSGSPRYALVSSSLNDGERFASGVYPMEWTSFKGRLGK